MVEVKNVMETLIQNGIKDPENPTTKDILKLLELESKSQIDKETIKNYFLYANQAVPKLIEALEKLVSQHVSKEYMETLKSRIETLNEAFKNAKTEEEREKNQEEVHKILQLMKEESKEQRNYLLKIGFGVVGGVIILGGAAFTVKNKELGQKIIEEGLKVVKKN